MEAPHNNQPVWAIVSLDKYSRCTVSRVKGSERKIYTLSKFLGSGVHHRIYELKPVTGKCKAVKIGVLNPRDQKEYDLLKKLNAQGSQIGISKPSKCLLKSEEIGLAIQIMPKYSASFEELIIHRQLLETDAIEAIKQIFFGLRYLHHNNIFHNDLHAGNVLCGIWKGIKRFDIADFESAVDITQLNEIKDTEKFNLEYLLIEIQSLYPQLDQLTPNERVIHLRRRLLNVDLYNLYNLFVAEFIEKKIIQNENVLKILENLFGLSPTDKKYWQFKTAEILAKQIDFDVILSNLNEASKILSEQASFK